MPVEKKLIPLCRFMPALILHKFIVRAQVHGQRFPTMRTNRQKFCGNPHSFLLFHHAADDFCILKGFLAAGSAALEQAIVPLCIKQPLFIKSGFLEAVIHIGCDNKIVFTFYKLKQVVIHRLRCVHIPVDRYTGSSRPSVPPA